MTTPPGGPGSTWEFQEYPVCSGDGWTSSILWYDLPDHTAAEDPETPGRCWCGHLLTEHDPADPLTDCYRIVSIRVLNLTSQRHRMSVGDAKTNDESAWQTPWIEPGDDRDYDTAGQRFYFTTDGRPFRVACL